VILDVRLPDGRVLTGVPEGTTQEQILSKLKAAGEDTSWAEPKRETGAEVEAKKQGMGSALLLGAGKKTDDILNGLTQLYLKARGENKALEGLAQRQQESSDIYAPLKRERPFATGFGEALPSMAVPGAGSSYLGAAFAGALPELLSYGSAEDRLKRGGIGAGAGMAGRALGGLVQSLLNPSGRVVNKAAMDAADRIGMKPLAGQATQNPAMLNVENYLARSAGSSSTMGNIATKNQEAINRAALKSIGQAGEEVSPTALQAAEQTIGNEFGRLQGVTSPSLGTDFVNALQKVESNNAALGPFRKPEIDKLIDKGLDLAAQGNLSGKAYKEIRSALSSEAQSQFKSGDATIGQAYKAIRAALDDAAEQSLSTADREAWKVARDQWANFKVLTKGNVSEAGNVSAARVAQTLRANGPNFRLGKTDGPLTDIARIGEAMKGPLNPNSGNLTHTAIGTAMAPANWTAAQLYTSPAVQKYLREGILDIGKNGELVLKATGVPIGTAATKNLLGIE